MIAFLLATAIIGGAIALGLHFSNLLDFLEEEDDKNV